MINSRNLLLMFNNSWPNCRARFRWKQWVAMPSGRVTKRTARYVYMSKTSIAILWHTLLTLVLCSVSANRIHGKINFIVRLLWLMPTLNQIIDGQCAVFVFVLDWVRAFVFGKIMSGGFGASQKRSLSCRTGSSVFLNALFNWKWS